MIDYELCTHCLSVTPLTEDICIFQGISDSELVLSGPPVNTKYPDENYNLIPIAHFSKKVKSF